MTHQQETLSQGWNAIACGSQKALDWVETVRQDSRRLDNEADKLNLSLHRARNLACSLMQVATTPMTVGFFGISQAGKSYLISALAAGNKGILVGEYGGKQVDFIKEVNPVGGGKEATGLVTRFTRNLPDTPLGFPVPLRLFSEIDLAKILANTWFNDFNHQTHNRCWGKKFTCFLSFHSIFSMARSHAMWLASESTESPTSSQFSFLNSSRLFSKATNSVVQTGVKSAGWLKSTNHLPR